MSSPPLALVDSHAHLYWPRFDEDRASVLANAQAAGVRHIVVPGTNLETSVAARDMCAEYPWLHFAAGVHPSDSGDASQADRDAIDVLCRTEECVAVGEAGLDFFHKENADLPTQEACFRWQLEMAVELDKPVIIHCRDAHEDTLRCVRDYPALRGVLHCFTFGQEEMQSYVDCGLMISYSGVVTYPRNDDNREAAKHTPLDHILIETDCPFLAPQPMRGKRNEPAFVAHVLASISQAKGLSENEVAQATTDNAKRLFGLA